MWILLALLLVIIFGVVIYNGLVKLREQVDAAWSDIDVQLKRRHDLIPNLVETVKGYATHEQTTLERVIQARSQAMTAQGPEDRGEAEQALNGALRSIFALSEAYPDLKANRSFLDLQENLSDTENQIERARRYYNAVVRDYNTKIRQIPSNVVATAFRFQPREFFEIDAGERAAPRLDLGTGS
jgi:LemA protein